MQGTKTVNVYSSVPNNRLSLISIQQRIKTKIIKNDKRTGSDIRDTRVKNTGKNCEHGTKVCWKWSQQVRNLGENLKKVLNWLLIDQFKIYWKAFKYLSQIRNYNQTFFKPILNKRVIITGYFQCELKITCNYDSLV